MNTPRENVLPAALPPDWRLLTLCHDGGAYMRDDGLLVVTNSLVTEDQHRWLHVSCSTTFRPPSQRDLQDVKSIFVGRDRVAVQVMPPAVRGPRAAFCLHLWSSLDDVPLPDFLCMSSRKAG